jgi:hypothetical protein
MLGTSPWTVAGLLLCTLSRHADGVHIELVDTAAGESSEQGEPWEDVWWLSLVGNRVPVAGKSGDAWSVTDVTDRAWTMLAASFACIEGVAATSERLCVLGPSENGEPGLWSTDLRGGYLLLRIVAPSICARVESGSRV